MTEMDELKEALRTLDRQMAQQAAASMRLETGRMLDRSRSAVRPLSALLWLETASGVAAAFLLVSFLSAHAGTLRFAVPAVVLLAATVVYVAVSARQLALLRHIDYSAPVVAIQRALAGLKAFRIRVLWWVLVLAPLAGTPVVIVIMEGVFGFDIVSAFGLPWVAANLGLGVVVLALCLRLSYRPHAWLRRSTLLRRVADELAGRSLAEALRRVAEAEAFERENDPAPPQAL